MGGAATAYAATSPPDDPPPLPWKWATLDPLEAGRRAYRFYKEKGGCGSASYFSLRQPAEGRAVGYPPLEIRLGFRADEFVGRHAIPYTRIDGNNVGIPVGTVPARAAPAAATWRSSCWP